MDTEFKKLHLSVIDLLSSDADLRKEQDVLDEHEELIDDLSARTNQLILNCTTNTEPEIRTVAHKRLTRLQKTIDATGSEIAKFDKESTIDNCLVRQREEQLREFKQELTDISRSLAAVDLDDKDEVAVLQSTLDKTIFDNSLKLKRLLEGKATISSATPHDSTGVKLPKVDVPTFNGNVLFWRSFWEHFSVSVDSRKALSDSEKLVYLRHAVKDGSAKQVIEGLSRTGDNYAEAVKCLKCRFDRPRLIHQTHVKKILDIPPLKQGSGKELRYLHDTVQQHLRALKCMDYEPSGPFVTSVLELKLDTATMFEWQKHTSGSTEVPHFNDLLEFVNLRAQASEHTVPDSAKKPTGNEMKRKPVPCFPANAYTPTSEPCPVCKTESHPVFACTKFRSLPHDRMITMVKENKLCINCLRPGHFSKHCKSLHKCKECQKPHHSLLHVDPSHTPAEPPYLRNPVSSNTATGLKSNNLLMTCQVSVLAPNGLSIKARALLDSGSSTSFVTEHLARSLQLRRTKQFNQISGITGFLPSHSSQSVTSFHVSPLNCTSKQFNVSAIIVPRVTCPLPVSAVALNSSWDHLNGIQLADPQFGTPGTIDILLGVDIFVGALLNGRRYGPPGFPTALETVFGWVLAGNADPHSFNNIVSCHTTLLSSDDLLRRFWEIEEAGLEGPVRSSEEQSVVKHYHDNHSRSPEGRFIVPLPKHSNAPNIGESRSQAVRRFLTLEHSLHSKGEFDQFADVMKEYFTLGHAEEVPIMDLYKPPKQVYYMPMHAVKKDSSVTTKLRVVFDASAKSNTDVSLNDTLMIGPTVHSSLVDVLLRFRLHPIALTADISKMYRAIELSPADKDYHRFLWRECRDKPLVDYRMTRLTFGVSASPFAANMTVKQNAINLKSKYPRAAAVVETSFYVDDCLTGAATVPEAAQLQTELQELFSEAQFTLRKWKSSDPAALAHVKPDLKEEHFTQSIPEANCYVKTLGVEWNSETDVFRLAIPQLPVPESATKRQIASDIAKTFDVMGWFSPSVIKAKILLQRIWERRINWDDAVPSDLLSIWHRWKCELPLLSNIPVCRCHFPCNPALCSTQLHGFSDASEEAYSAVVYIRIQDPTGSVHVSLVTSKTRVAPLKRQTIPRLELCGALLLSQVITHVNEVFDLPNCDLVAWTDSTVVLDWLKGDPRRFKPFVGNRVTRILEKTTAALWRHVRGYDNPADCASRGLFPSELSQHSLWWNGPSWLTEDPQDWPRTVGNENSSNLERKDDICLVSLVASHEPVISLDRYSTFTRLQHVTAWIQRFVRNCRTSKSGHVLQITPRCLSVTELTAAETYWITFSQQRSFSVDLNALKLSQRNLYPKLLVSFLYTLF